jgi:2-polyprenyl-3-methyl-5-hydroxy-6-metoxy-1,4-benzoquinol methylase
MKITETLSEYQYSSNRLDHTYTYLTDPLLKILLDCQTNNGTNKLRILDLGCGNGSFSNTLKNIGYDVVGIEASTSGVEIAKQYYPECQFINASIYDLPYDELGVFDVIIAVEVIEHLFDPKELIKAAKKCLKPGGTIVVTTPYHGYWKNLFLAILGHMDRHFTTLWDGGHIKFFSVPTLTQLLKTEGCTDIHFNFAGRFPYLWKSMLCTCKFQ